ncbi:MAG TPA: cation-transporting P-type ATPase, partial [Nostoc sp.]|uniref:cation-transporting P-type ATPase n=1 Tax=Nostoc sp. TaxID=1180 RepID=UPI002D2CD149
MVQAASPIASQEKQFTVWHTLENSEAIARLHSDAENGLSSAVAKQLLSEVGANELTGKKSKPWWLKFLLQFNQPLLIILLCAGLVKALTGS